MHTVAAREARKVSVTRPEGNTRRFDYIGSPGLIDENPQAFLVDRLHPGARIPPHFHDIDQFQVVVGGDCMMGKQAAPPISFQYADAYTPYGPIVGEKYGFAFFTLRPIASGGFFPMPGSRQHMPGRAGRNIAGHFDQKKPMPAPGQVEQEVLMKPQADGVDAVGLRLGPGARAAGPESNAGGQYYLVCQGSASHAGGEPLTEYSLMHVAAGEAPPVLTAGEEGAAILVLQFARPSERPGSDPSQLAKRDPGAYRARPE